MNAPHPLHIITPGFRVNFLKKIAENLATYYKDQNFIWHLIMDQPGKLKREDLLPYCDVLGDKLKIYEELTTFYPWGFEQRNYFTNVIANNYPVEDWCYFLDDDNLMTIDIFYMFEKYKLDSTAKYIGMSQLRYKDPQLRLWGIPDHATLGLVDIGSFLFRSETLINIPMNLSCRSADGWIAHGIVALNPGFAKWEPNYMTTYNILQLTT